jgi:hypothetical protein
MSKLDQLEKAAAELKRKAEPDKNIIYVYRPDDDGIYRDQFGNVWDDDAPHENCIYVTYGEG